MSFVAFWSNFLLFFANCLAPKHFSFISSAYKILNKKNCANEMATQYSLISITMTQLTLNCPELVVLVRQCLKQCWKLISNIGSSSIRSKQFLRFCFKATFAYSSFFIGQRGEFKSGGFVIWDEFIKFSILAIEFEKKNNRKNRRTKNHLNCVRILNINFWK